jgi:hypothetical protein
MARPIRRGTRFTGQRQKLTVTIHTFYHCSGWQGRCWKCRAGGGARRRWLRSRGTLEGIRYSRLWCNGRCSRSCGRGRGIFYTGQGGRGRCGINPRLPAGGEKQGQEKDHCGAFRAGHSPMITKKRFHMVMKTRRPGYPPVAWTHAF